MALYRPSVSAYKELEARIAELERALAAAPKWAMALGELIREYANDEIWALWDGVSLKAIRALIERERADANALMGLLGKARGERAELEAKLAEAAVERPLTQSEKDLLESKAASARAEMRKLLANRTPRRARALRSTGTEAAAVIAAAVELYQERENPERQWPFAKERVIFGKLYEACSALLAKRGQ